MTGLKTRKRVLAASLLLMPILAPAQEALDPFNQELASQAMFAQGVVAVAGAVMVIAVIWMALHFATQRERRRQELIAKFLDKEREIPSELLPGAPSQQRELRRGVWLASSGLGIGVVLFVASGEWRVAAWCLILLFLSAASFLNAALFYRDASSDR